MNLIRDLYAEDEGFKGKVQTLEEALGATVVHESVHGTDKAANSNLSDGENTEEPAIKVESKFLDELEKIHKQ